MSLIKITISNWTKFNPRSDRANYTWFRLQNTLFSDQKVFGLTHSQIALYLFLLCEASKGNKEELEISPAYIAALLKYDASEIDKDIKVLCDVGLMTAKSRPNDGQKPTKLPATNGRTNVTDERNVTNVNLPEAEKPKSQIIKETYCNAYKKRYGINPTWAAKENTQAKRLIESIGFIEAQKLSGAYLDYPDPWHVRQKHPFTLLVAQVDKIRVELNNNTTPKQNHAAKIIEALQKFGISGYENFKEVRDFLGEDAYCLSEKIGTWRFLYEAYSKNCIELKKQLEFKQREIA